MYHGLMSDVPIERLVLYGSLCLFYCSFLTIPVERERRERDSPAAISLKSLKQLTTIIWIVHIIFD